MKNKQLTSNISFSNRGCAWFFGNTKGSGTSVEVTVEKNFWQTVSFCTIYVAPSSTQPFILPRSIKWVRGISGDLVVKSKLPRQSGSNQPSLPTWRSWIFLIFCQVNVPIEKWKSWKFYVLIMKGFKLMTTWTMDPLAWTANHYYLWHFEIALIQPVLIVNIRNFEWGFIFWKYLLQKTSLVKILKITPVVEC